MSHFSTLILFESRPDDLQQACTDMLAPFDEAREVDPWEEDCYCIGLVARKESLSIAEKLCGTLDSLRDSFRRLPKETKAQWKKHIATYIAVEKKAFDEHPLKDKPDPKCGFDPKTGERYSDGSGCGGTGKYMTTYNPKSKWDWWVIGGRWKNTLPNKRNICKVSELVNGEYVPFAILTPDGQWHEHGSMGWWGIVTDEKNNWDDEVKNILSQYTNCHAVLCDLHI